MAGETSASSAIHLTLADAAAHGEFVDYGDLAECHVDGERCFTFAPGTDPSNREQQFIEHAARELGVCWACSQPVTDWANRENCPRCWLMYHAEVEGLWPRDCPPFPGRKNGSPSAGGGS